MCAVASQMVLFVEDDDNDRLLIARSLRKLGLGFKARFFENGAKAIDFLSTQGNEDEPGPGLMVLDVKLPGCSGFDVLSWIRSHPRFKDLPVVMFTSSDQTSDRETAEHLGASDYVVKPAALQDYHTTLRSIFERLNIPPAQV
jgi:CheY-like chemotaxis protein